MCDCVQPGFRAAWCYIMSMYVSVCRIMCSVDALYGNIAKQAQADRLHDHVQPNVLVCCIMSKYILCESMPRHDHIVHVDKLAYTLV